MQKKNIFIAAIFLFFYQLRGQNAFVQLEPELLEKDQLFSIVDSSYILPLTFNSSQWHSRVINPFKYDFKQFKEQVSFSLYDEATGEPIFCIPHHGRVTSCFGPRWGNFHYGTDILLNVGDTVVAARDGIVRIATWEPGYGNFIVLSHEGGLETLYGHLSDFLVKPEDTVYAKQPIALGGNTGYSTGPHLHFEIRYLGSPLNPEKAIDFYRKSIKTNTLTISAKTFDYLSPYQNRYGKSYTYQANYGGSGALYHTIRYGDCLYNLAKQYGTTVYKICALNGITTKTVLRPGKTIRVR